MRKIELIQHGFLENVATEYDPERRGDVDYSGLFRLSQDICKRNNFCALAMNQIPKSIIKEYTNGNGYCRAIFLESDKDEKNILNEDILILNPEIKVRGTGCYTSIEACGSIDHTDSFVLIKRPSGFDLNGFVYTNKTRKPKWSLIKIEEAKEGNAVEHEIDHLNGQTALNFPDKIVDPRKNIDQIKKIQRLIALYQKSFTYIKEDGAIVKMNTADFCKL